MSCAERERGARLCLPHDRLDARHEGGQEGRGRRLRRRHPSRQWQQREDGAGHAKTRKHGTLWEQSPRQVKPRLTAAPDGGYNSGMTQPPQRRLSVAIDGPAGAGKSTVARQVAQALGYTYVDTGAMYRAVAWAVLDREVDPADAEAVTTLAGALDIH